MIGDEKAVIDKITADTYNRVLQVGNDYEIYKIIQQGVSMALVAGKDYFGNPNTIFIYNNEDALLTVPSVEAAAYCLDIDPPRIKEVLNKEETVKGFTFKTRAFVNKKMKISYEKSA